MSKCYSYRKISYLFNDKTEYGKIHIKVIIVNCKDARIIIY